MLNLSIAGNAVLLPIKVVPGAARNRYLGEWNGRARLAVSAAPEKGKANAAVVKLLAKLLNHDKRNISMISGLSSPLKTIRIDRISADAVRAALESVDPES